MCQIDRFVSFAKLTRHLPQGMQREDLVVKFGHLTSRSFSSSSLQVLAELVAVSENVSTGGETICMWPNTRLLARVTDQDRSVGSDNINAANPEERLGRPRDAWVSKRYIRLYTLY
jgi:hypothetical protein